VATGKDDPWIKNNNEKETRYGQGERRAAYAARAAKEIVCGKAEPRAVETTYK
jgi:hypothetical protein